MKSYVNKSLVCIFSMFALQHEEHNYSLTKYTPWYLPVDTIARRSSATFYGKHWIGLSWIQLDFEEIFRIGFATWRVTWLFKRWIQSWFPLSLSAAWPHRLIALLINTSYLEWRCVFGIATCIRPTFRHIHLVRDETPIFVWGHILSIPDLKWCR
jgi:hypothetical protein